MTADEQPAAVDRLASFLAAVEPGRGGKVVAYRPISGGYSRETAMAEVRWADGSIEKFILRADPPGGVGVFHSDRDDEWELLRALAEVDTFEIPRPRWYDADGKHFGTKCIVMDFCEGTPLQLTLVEGSDLSGATDVYLEVAAALRRTPLAGLPTRLAHGSSWDDYIDEAIGIYERAERDLPDCSPVVRYVVAWLRAHWPPPIPLGLVHGDLQPGNILVAEGTAPVVIDWEFTRIGDPREDVGYYSNSPLPTSLYEADRGYFLERYRELTGLTADEVNEEILEYFFMLGMAKLYAQMMEGAAAVTEGRPATVMNLFLVNSLSYFQGRYLDICNSTLSGATLTRSNIVIAKPTTDQILLECCRQLSDVVLPAIDDETVKVTVMMLDLVLRNVAVRSAHEVAWMQDETDELVAFAAGVLAARPGADGLVDAVAESTDDGAASLHLADVVERYRRASEAFSVALEAAVAADDTELVEQGAAVLGRRIERETEVMSGWSPLGR